MLGTSACHRNWMSWEVVVALLDLLLTEKEEPVGDETINGSPDCSNYDTRENI